MSRLRTLLLAASAILPMGIASAFAGPNGASVVAGSATVQGQGTASVVVNQLSQSAIINWNTFNIGAGEKTAITMPGASSVELDRVTGNLGPSQIYGSLSSNGQVFLVNPDGILVGPTGKINTTSFLATTHDIANSDFMAGRYSFSIPGMPNASVVNQGSITAQTGGFAALVAPGVRNTGIITAKLGTVALASGNAFTLDFYGDNLITLGLNDSIAAAVTDVSTGQPLSSLVSNTGTLKANGGRVELTAVAARAVVDSVINNTGVIEANTIGTHNGMIELEAATAASKPTGSPAQTVKVSGRLSAAGKRKGTTGGTVLITGEDVQLSGANINASSRSGGGAVLIGGDTDGGNPSALVASIVGAALESFAVPTATTVGIDTATTINTSATDTGNGGKVIVWSNEATTFYGNVLATGGASGGNGGFVETSGQQLAFGGIRVDTLAPAGKAGTWLVDPTDLTVDSTGAATIVGNLGTTNVTLQTNADGTTSGPGNTSSGPGDIIVNAPISWSSANTLSLLAYNNIAINAALTGTSGGLVLNAGSIITDTAVVSVGTFTLQGGQWQQVSSTLPTFFANDFQLTGGSFLRVLGGDGTAGSPYQITDVYGLQGIGSSTTFMDQDFVLANDITASSTVNWNGGAGFVPIGYSSASTTNSRVPTHGPLVGINATPTEFLGTFDGAGHTISNLVINNTGAFNLGLFSWIGSGGTVENVGLVGGSLVAGAYSNFGLLAGWNFGTISNSYATGTVSAGDAALNIGGLVGWNWGGTVSNSYATGNVSGGEGSDSIGGLVGAGGYFLYGGGTITNSYATGNVSGGSSSGDIGGLIGGNNSAAVRNSYATGNVSGGEGSDSIGGLAGSNNGYWGGDIITSSFATGNVTGGSGSSYVGGLIGVNLWAGALTNSYATGSVTGGIGVGGLVGWNGYTDINQHIGSTISTSYAIGRVSGATYVGGLIGYNNSGTITDSYWDTQATGLSNGLGGTNGGAFSAAGLTTAQALAQSNYLGFDFTNVWAINPGINSGYPYLISNPPPATTTTTVKPAPLALPPGQSQLNPTQVNGSTALPTSFAAVFSEIMAALPVSGGNNSTDADPALIQGLISALNPNAVYQNGNIYPSGYTGDPTQCVALTEALSPYQIPSGNIGTTWTPENGTIGPNTSLAPGTPIATFDATGHYPQSGNPPTIQTSSGPQEVHAATYLGPVKDLQGNVIGMYMLDQNTPWNGGKAEVRIRLFSDMTLPYSVIAPSPTISATN